MAVGSSAAGLLADGLVRRGMPVTAVRKRIQTVAFLGPAAALLVLANRGISPRAAVACLTVALGTTSLGAPPQGRRTLCARGFTAQLPSGGATCAPSGCARFAGRPVRLEPPLSPPTAGLQALLSGARAPPAAAATPAVRPRVSAQYARALRAGQAGFVANMSDIAPRHAGQMFGLCNTFGSAAGIVGVSAVGYIVQTTGSFDPVFKLTALLYVLGAVVWNLFCVGTQVFE